MLLKHYLGGNLFCMQSIHLCHRDVVRLSSFCNNASVDSCTVMSAPIPISRQQTDQLLRWLKGFRALGGAVAIHDLQRYLYQCLRAQALQDQGFKARVCGQWQHWLLVVEGGKGAPTQSRARPIASQRRLRKMRSRSNLRVALQSKPRPQTNSTKSTHLPPWYLD